MIDIHCHVLPGMDDGAKDEDVALSMLQMAEDSGTTAIIATPHVIDGDWLPSWDKIVQKCQDLQEMSRDRGLSICLYPGAEVAITMDMLDLISGPGAYCLNGGKYMLVELPSTHIPEWVDEFLFRLQAKDITPVLAHPERHPKIDRNPQILWEWARRGILMQVNAPSIVGVMGRRVQKVAELLLHNNLRNRCTTRHV